MEISTFEMMDGVSLNARYIIVAKNEHTKIGIRHFAGPTPETGPSIISAGFKLRIEGVTPMIPCYKGSGGDHYGSFFVKPLFEYPAFAHWIHPFVKEEMRSWVNTLFGDLAKAGLDIIVEPALVADYMIEAFQNDFPEPVIKNVEGDIKFQVFKSIPQED
jgi:hypothetical protein